MLKPTSVLLLQWCDAIATEGEAPPPGGVTHYTFNPSTIDLLIFANTPVTLQARDADENIVTDYDEPIDSFEATGELTFNGSSWSGGEMLCTLEASGFGPYELFVYEAAQPSIGVDQAATVHA